MKCIYWILISVAAFLHSCGMEQERPSYRIAFSQCVEDDAWRQTMLEEMKRELSFHPEVEFIYCNANNSSELQAMQLRELLDIKPDLIIVSPNEAEPLTAVVDHIYRSGIPVIVTDRKTSSGLYHAYVGADNYKIGFLAGQYIASQIHYKGKISEITGLPGSSAAIERQKGFHDALHDYPGIQIKQEINGQWLIGVARDRVAASAEILVQSDAVFAYNDQMAIGTYEALKQSFPGLQPKIVGVDALPGPNNGLQFVADKKLYASMLYPTGGKECIQTAVAILENKPYHREILLSTSVVDSTNVQLMKLQADKTIRLQQDIDKQQELFVEQKILFSNQQRVLNILVVSLVLAIVFAGLSFYSLKANWDKNKQLEIQNQEILGQQQRILEMTRAVEQATASKINMFTNISHEFKTPLSLILISLEELINNGKSSGNNERLLGLIRKNALLLKYLVSQLIDFQRVGYENLRIKARKQNLLIFCSNIVQCFRPMAQRNNISLRLENETSDPVLWFDDTLVEKLLYNLLSNSFKFTPAGGEIVVKLINSKTNDAIDLCVADTGMGIAEADMAHLFEPFYQGENHAQGSGIGLALCKEIATKHHGSIAVESTKALGTMVKVTLPKGELHLAAEEKVDNTMSGERPWLKDNTLLALLETETAGSDVPEVRSVPRAESILIVEDHPDMRLFLAEKLAEEYTVYTASNIHEAQNVALDHMPDLIISDVLMPGGEGTDLARKLKSDIRTAGVPIILLTARGTDEQVLAGLEALADAYVTKPFDFKYLSALMANLIENRKILQRRFNSDMVSLDPSPNTSPSDQRFIRELAALVEDNIASTKLNIDFLCDKLGVSRVQLYRKVKLLLDCSVTDYISSRRLQKAKVMIRRGVPINSVAYETGFSTPAYFSTSFKNKYGVSPSTFKKNLPNEQY